MLMEVSGSDRPSGLEEEKNRRLFDLLRLIRAEGSSTFQDPTGHPAWRRRRTEGSSTS